MSCKFCTRPAKEKQQAYQRLYRLRNDRREYFKARYKENREELKAKSLDRYYKKRETELSHDDSAS